MKKNKGFAPIAIVIIIIAVLAVCGIAYYVGKSSNTTPVVENNLPQDNQNGVVNIPTTNTSVTTSTTTTTTTSNQNEHTYTSNTFGYSIGYSGIDINKVYIEGDGKKISLFPDQSYIDNLEVVDSSYVVASYISLVGTATFGTNQYKKFKDNVTPRHTYYFKSGLKNGKAVFISVENDSDNPSYLDLASFEIQQPVCNTGYDKTDESKVVSEQSPALITGFEKKCDGNYYFTFDYLANNPVSGNGDNYDWYTNTNSKLRTFKMNSNLKVKLTDNTEISLNTYVNSLKKMNGEILNQNNAYIRNAPNGQAVVLITVNNGIVDSMKEMYLP